MNPNLKHIDWLEFQKTSREKKISIDKIDINLISK